MIVLPRHFVRFLDGRAGAHVNIAFLPGEIGAKLGTLETYITIKRDYGLKLIAHGIKYEQFFYIQETIDNGMCIKDGDFRIKFLYVRDNVRPEIYFLLIKTDRLRKELWLVTFHRIKRKQFTDRTDPSRIIRDHAELGFMG